MDDGRLDRIEQTLLRGARLRAQCAPVPQDFTARVMREVRGKIPARGEFWDVFGLVARRFAPVGVLAATGALGYAQVMDRVLNQALVSISLHGGGNVITLAGLMP